jgi:hypothetical protein
MLRHKLEDTEIKKLILFVDESFFFNLKILFGFIIQQHCVGTSMSTNQQVKKLCINANAKIREERERRRRGKIIEGEKKESK